MLPLLLLLLLLLLLQLLLLFVLLLTTTVSNILAAAATTPAAAAPAGPANRDQQQPAGINAVVRLPLIMSKLSVQGLGGKALFVYGLRKFRIGETLVFWSS